MKQGDRLNDEVSRFKLSFCNRSQQVIAVTELKLRLNSDDHIDRKYPIKGFIDKYFKCNFMSYASIKRGSGEAVSIYTISFDIRMTILIIWKTVA